MADPYSALYGEDPQAAQDAAQALAQAMAKRRAAGTIGTVVGGPFAASGKQFSGEADQTADLLTRALQSRANLKFQRERMDAYAPNMEEQAASRAEKNRIEQQKVDIQRQKLLMPPPVKPPKPLDTVKTADELRKEFQGQQGYKDFQQVSAAYKKIQTTSETGAGDMSLIFGYMKLLDPNSTVREGEYATAANAGSVPQSLLASYNKVVSGEKLAPEVRKQFRDEATKVFGAQKAQFDQVAKPYIDIAKKRGIPPEDVIFGYQEAPPAVPAAPAAGAPVKRPTRTINGETREWDGKAWVPVKGG